MARTYPVHNLYHYRVAKNFTQTSLAKALGLSRSHYVRIETGKADATIDVLRRLSTTLKVPQYALLREDMF